MALQGVRVLELAGLAPSPFCGMILSDFGADVIRVDRPGGSPQPDTLCRGKRSIALNLKDEKGRSVLKRMAQGSDVLVEPFRKGVMEKLGIGPKVLMKENPRLVYARLTGFGQSGPLSERAGHDINYLAISGVLSTLGRHGDKPYAPVNLLADFAGGGLMCALGVVMALYERTKSGAGQVIDANMVEGAAYVGSFLWSSGGAVLGEKGRGLGLLDSGCPWYDTYETKDGLYVSVGAIEPQFYAQLIDGLGLELSDYPQYGTDWAELRRTFEGVFRSRTQAEWSEVFEGRDACVFPVVDRKEVASHPHNATRQSFHSEQQGGVMPEAAPRLSRTPAGYNPTTILTPGQDTFAIMKEYGYSNDEITHLQQAGAIDDPHHTAKY